MANDIQKINSRTPVLDGSNFFARTWYRFFERTERVSNLIQGEIVATAAAGSASLPATPEGFFTIQVGGEIRKVPFYK